MELTVLKYLPLEDVPRRIVYEFLRKHHPTAALIKELTFERETLEFDDDSTRDYLFVYGPHVRILRKNVFFGLYQDRPSRCLTPRLRSLTPDTEHEFRFCYESEGDPHNISSILYWRLASYYKMLRIERGVKPRQHDRWWPDQRRIAP